MHQSTPKKDLYIDVDANLLDETHRENLEFLKLPLPSEIKPENYADILKRITKEKTNITNGNKKLVDEKIIQNEYVKIWYIGYTKGKD